MFVKKPLPAPDLVNADFAQIEARLMADMASTFSKTGSQEIAHMTRTGTVTGRLTHNKPAFYDVDPSGKGRKL